jgi:hypothetical protein
LIDLQQFIESGNAEIQAAAAVTSSRNIISRCAVANYGIAASRVFLHKRKVEAANAIA